MSEFNNFLQSNQLTICKKPPLGAKYLGLDLQGQNMKRQQKHLHFISVLLFEILQDLGFSPNTQGGQHHECEITKYYQDLGIILSLQWGSVVSSTYITNSS